MAEGNDVGKLLELLRALQIPDTRPRVLPTLLGRRRPLPRPLVELVDVADRGPLLVEIYRWLGESGSRRATPRARIDLRAPELAPEALTPDRDATGEELTAHCLPLLQAMVEGFSTDDTAMGPIKFPRYRTADWLTRQRVTADESEAAVELRSRLPRLLRSGSPTSRSDTAEGVAGDTFSRLVFGVLALWPVLRLWLWVSGRVPGMSKVTRWFMHQRYLAPELSDSFLGFATRLTATRRRDENTEQVAKLLVHAFLEDLRDAYRRRLWKPSSWRRTAYPVALLGGVAADSAGARLLHWINDIRNETGQFDPLVVLATVDPTPDPASVRDIGDIGDLRTLRTLESLATRPYSGRQPDPLQRWLRNIEHLRTNRLPDAWLLPLRARLPAAAAQDVRDPAFAELAGPPSPPLAARRWFVALCVVIPVALVAGAVLWSVPALRGAACAHLPWTSGVSVAMRDGECVGYSDNAAQVFTDDNELAGMQREVFALNERAEGARANNPRRPVVTLVYFAGLSYLDTNARYPHAQVQELAGLAVQQRLALRGADDSEPLLRVVVANGGTDMRHAEWVVDELLAPLLSADTGILGVVGLDRSTTETRRAITALGELGVPAVATTLSADGLDQASPLYFQAAPSNRVQARLVADYVQGARRTGPDAGVRAFDKVVVYHPADTTDDLYVDTLVKDLQRELTARGIPQDSHTWRAQPELHRIEAPCETPGFDRRTLLFYAGRNDDFPPFAKAVTRGCLSGATPVILGNDAVTRLITDPVARAAMPATVPVRYVTKAAPVLLGGADCVNGTGHIGDQPVPLAYEQLCAELSRLLTDLRAEPGLGGFAFAWASDRTGLAYDVAGLFLQAVRAARGVLETTPNRTAVAMQLRESNFPGVTGTLGFTDGRVADGSSLAILVTSALGQPGPQKCLIMYPRTTGDGCPAGTGSDLEDWVAPN